MNRYQVAAQIATELFHGGPRQDHAKEVIADALGTVEEEATKPLREEIERLKTLLELSYEAHDEALADKERFRTERDEARATKDMHKERQEEEIALRLKAESANRALVEALKQAWEFLAAARDVIATLQKECGWLPEQQAYSATMTENERLAARAVADIDHWFATRAALVASEESK